MSDGIKLGSCLFTLVEPKRGRARAYNEWYERDHFYAGMMAMPHVFAARRWVATRELKHLCGAPTGFYELSGWAEREAGGVRPELALDHPLPTPGFDVGAEPLHLLFLDAAPEDCVADWQVATPHGRWARAFVPTIPGTDGYLDRL